jgi:hypothetical protein
MYFRPDTNIQAPLNFELHTRSYSTNVLLRLDAMLCMYQVEYVKSPNLKMQAMQNSIKTPLLCKNDHVIIFLNQNANASRLLHACNHESKPISRVEKQMKGEQMKPKDKDVPKALFKLSWLRRDLN